MTDRLERMTARLPEKELDGILISAPDNRQYMSGFTGSAGYLFIAKGKAVLVTDSRYTEQAANQAPGFEVVQIKGGWDWLVESCCEVGVLLNILLLILGSIFARPTWGVWWDWDPRLTSSAVMMLTFIGVLVLRSVVDDPDRRALWSSVATIIAYVNIPVTYFSVRWWRSLHQVQSSPETVSDMMVDILRLNAFAFLFITIWFLARRWRIAKSLAAADMAPPLPFQENA